MKIFQLYIKENIENIVDLKSKIKDSLGSYKTKDISTNRFNIYVPAKERMKIAEKLAKDFDGQLADSGNVAGKPVVDFKNNLRVFIKPIPGSGVGGTAKEDAQLASLQKQIETELSDNNVTEIPIKIGGRMYYVAGAASTPGTPKSDFHLLDAKSNEIVWISHKNGSKPKDFQQWSGISKSSEPKIAAHKETEDFVDDVKNKTDGEMPRATTYSRENNDQRLANMAVYGKDYGGKLGRQNVTLLLQGPVKLIKKKNHYEITSNHTSVNGDKMVGGYTPVFMAMYKGDRSNYGVKGARFAIQPKDSRKSKDI